MDLSAPLDPRTALRPLPATCPTLGYRRSLPRILRRAGRSDAPPSPFPTKTRLAGGARPPRWRSCSRSSEMPRPAGLRGPSRPRAPPPMRHGTGRSRPAQRRRPGPRAFDDARASVIALAEGRATGGRRDRSAERATLRGCVPDAERGDDRHRAGGRRDGARTESADAEAQATRAYP